MHLLASSWYYSGLSCDTQTALVLYAIPLSGDVVQFIIIDKLQAAARTRTMHMPCTCQAHAMHMPCTCHAPTTHMHMHMHMCNMHMSRCRHSASSRELRTRPAILKTSTKAALPSAIAA